MRVVILCCLLVVALINGVSGGCANPLPYAVTAKGYCAYVWASNLGQPRGIAIAANNDVIVVDRSAGRILVLWESGSTTQRAQLAALSGLNHAVVIHGSHIYASTSTHVYRWRYTPGQRSDLGAYERVAHSIPCCGHVTRALAFDRAGHLYVQSGSAGNVDSDSSHSQIRRFDISTLNTTEGINWQSAELFADGLRNEAGIRFDAQDRLWGVENGCDNLNRADLGGDIHNDNPAEEVNLLNQPGAFYGYPYCWTEGNLTHEKAQGKGAQWVHPNFMNDGVHSDEWCRNTRNVVVPAYNLQAHTAPLDILFYYGKEFPGLEADAFVAQRGSWNRQPPVGYRVLHLNFENGKPVSDDVFLAYQGPGETGANWPHRPVALGLARCGGRECLLVTSDASGVIIAVMPSA